ncbi:MAG TPA: two-component regulator propeller domain-containing protein, partial [Christiangramia sp.]|nr:two-component regulator propeller domain-containing protein [Christiangramia sp.]
MPFYRINKPLFLLLFCLNLAFAQDFPVKNYTAATELPNNKVRSLLVDSNNALWIGTDNVVVKKENDVFKSYFDEDGLALNSCWAIAEDKYQHIWFGSYGGGVSIYDGNSFKIISEKDGLVHNEITKLFSFKDHMFIGTSHGVSIINLKSFKVFTPEAPTRDELFRVTGFFEYQGQVHVVTYRTGIYKIDLDKKNATLEKLSSHEFIYSVFRDKDSIYSSNKGFYTKNLVEDYVSNQDSVTPDKLGKSIVWDHVETNNESIYAAAWGIYDTNGGIYEIRNGEFISRASDFNVPSKNIISLAYDDEFERLYIGSLDAGLYEVTLDPQIKFSQVPGKDVLGFAETKNTSALLLNDGLLIKQLQGKKNITLRQLKQWQRVYVSTTKIPLPKYEDSFYELDYTTNAEEISFYDVKVSADKYWLNTNIGIFVIENSGDLDRYIPLHTEEINFTDNGDLIETHPYGGVRVYSDLDEFKYEHYQQKDPQTPTQVVNSLRLEDKTYFLSVFSGLYSWENNEFKSYLDEDIWNEPKLRHITTLGRDLAISTEFGDVFIANNEDKFEILRKIPRANIPGNTLSFLKEYEGHLLIGTEKGLTIFKDDRYIFLDSEQGLKQPLYSAVVNDNILKVGTHNGYYNIDLDAVIDSKALVDLVKLEEIYINNAKFFLKQIPGKEKIDLAYDENTVLLKFSANAHPY